MAIEHKYAKLRGDFFIKKRGTAELPYFLGNVSEASLGMTVETDSLESSGNERGKLAVWENSRDATLSMTLNSVAATNAKLYFYSNASVTQDADTGFTADYPVGDVGELIKLPHVNVKNVVVTVTPAEGEEPAVTLTEGEDYQVYAKGGALRLLKKNEAKLTAGISYDVEAATSTGVFTSEGDEYELIYISEATGKRIEFRRWKPNPAQAVSLISSDWASFQLEGSCLIDETIASGPLGRIAVVHDAA